MTDAEQEREQVIARIRAAFAATPHPGDPFIQGSHEGDEPFEMAAAFRGRHDWTALDAAFLDREYTALSFLSEGGFRFYLPAWLVAEVRGELMTADPTFHLTHGFHDWAHDERIGARVVRKRMGASVPVNPRRYGAITTYDHARYRLAVFTREEAEGIVAFLRWRREHDADAGFTRAQVDAALDRFWLERARSAPTAAMLAEHLREERELMEALEQRYGGGTEG